MKQLIKLPNELEWKNIHTWKEFIIFIYQQKIKLMFYFNMGYGEFSTPLAVIKDVGIILALFTVLLKVDFSWLTDIIICLSVIVGFVLIGIGLKLNGLADFNQRIGNSINPEIKLINKIAEKLEIK